MDDIKTKEGERGMWRKLSTVVHRITKRHAALGVLSAMTVASTILVILPTTNAQAAGTWSTETISGMSVRLYVPSTAPKLADGRALMVNLHGCIQTSTDLANGGNWETTADEYGMVVAIPSAPNGGVIAGCWDYYDTNHTRTSTSRHDDNLLGLVDNILNRPALGVDRDQVYISGLSSGAGESMVMGCLAPDVFAGVGINAGPTVGTTSGQISSVATNAAQATTTCNKFADRHTDGFASQLTSVIHSNDDYTVNTGYNLLNAQVMAGLYGASQTSAINMSSLPGSNTAGSGTVWSDAKGPRVSLLTNTALGHNWPAGGGSGGNYIRTSSIDYPRYLTDFFFANNRRIERGITPSTTTSAPSTTTVAPTTTVSPTTTSTPTACWTEPNITHQAAGRATSYGINPHNPYYASGTNDYLGQGNATITSLRAASNSRYTKVASCA
ncbi:hypothetical protein RQCS_58610 (plasmid) [Rhodococcus qingshengii]|uniref:extracellular catalytic domain type 1 short-chain-length polyhydroxyalkanoate depolymerase n=1 Tax=Rhodococcus qingshengii TaxID=334542 RepID=UPI000AE97901|nr:PHB depolymerase family esterase [Rhodococcus qingshengii]BCF86316.1 hypothetical protein RQCS_58610 [Rhodococcus qingshengii]